MTSKIDSLNPAAINLGAATKAAADKGAGTAVASSAAPAPVDKVSLTGNAVRLQQLAIAASETPEVDTKRINATRSAIASGTYQINAKSIAAKLSRMDWELGG
ncbi:flagellar biosynthesis anti-sigma factor FlgM [Nevskia soli]|uniref:flagellar biosynthesis anti-sigma factor FlgM n=1 Tax=Nevskia soli TaxID=418856 RepID=UPI00068B3C67|nr:flagellar biosynthesis anti-sigma factor FlgM [Nevskia soli]